MVCLGSKGQERVEENAKKKKAREINKKRRQDRHTHLILVGSGTFYSFTGRLREQAMVLDQVYRGFLFLEGYTAVAHMLSKVMFTFGYSLLRYFHKEGRDSGKDGILHPYLQLGFRGGEGQRNRRTFYLVDLPINTFETTLPMKEVSTVVFLPGQLPSQWYTHGHIQGGGWTGSLPGDEGLFFFSQVSYIHKNLSPLSVQK